jgi:hypothetical protein
MEESISKPLCAMITYYGGHISNTLNETCTHAFSCDYELAIKIKTCSETKSDADEYKKCSEAILSKLGIESNNESTISLLVNQIKLVTPDWVIECIEENRLIEELAYNPLYLRTNPENKKIIDEENKEQTKMEANTNKIEDNEEEKKSNKFDAETFESKITKQINFIVASSSPTPRSPFTPGSSTATLNAITDIRQQSSIKINKITEESDLNLNSMTSTILPALSEQSSPSQSATTVVGVESPAKVDKQEESMIMNNTNTTNNNSTPSKQKSKRIKKPSISTGPQANVTSSSAFSVDMNEIFQSVLGGDDDSEEKKSGSVNVTGENNSSTKNKNDALLPIYLNLLKPLQQIQTNLGLNTHSTASIFDEDSLSQETYFIQENSHLLHFDKCLLGCVFYLKCSETYYTPDCIADWQKVIERFGGCVANEYNSSSCDEITHLICPNRFSEIYRRVRI